MTRLVPGALDDRVDGPDGRAVVLSGQDVTVLSPLAAHLLRLVSTGTTELGDLADAITAAAGPPPQGVSAGQAVLDLARELEAIRLLRIVTSS